MNQEQRSLLDQLQSHFPLSQRPYRTLARRLGMPEPRLRQKIARLKERGVIRRIGAIVSAGAIRYHTVLLAAAVPLPRVERVASRLNRMEEVTHNYLRPGKYNVWFTLHSATPRGLRLLIRRIQSMKEIEDLLVLPAEKVYKISAVFPL